MSHNSKTVFGPKAMELILRDLLEAMDHAMGMDADDEPHQSVEDNGINIVDLARYLRDKHPQLARERDERMNNA